MEFLELVEEEFYLLLVEVELFRRLEKKLMD